MLSAKKTIVCLLLCTPLLQGQSQPITTIQLGNPAGEPLRGTEIGLNIEMALTSDSMWKADNYWMHRTFREAGVRTLRWGYSAIWWDAFEEKPMTDNYWSGKNSADAAGSLGFKEFVDYCKKSRTTPIIMLPVDAVAAGIPMERVLALSRKMTEYVASQKLETMVYLEAGNEPYFKPKLPKETYAEALRALYPMVKAINPKFRLVAEMGGDYHPFITDTCANYFDVVEWHCYLECGGKGKAPWEWYFAKDSDDLLHTSSGYQTPVIPPGKEYIIGEINVLWPDWEGPMAGDRRSSLAYLNLMLATINDNKASIVTPWPSHWPGNDKSPDYGFFNYNAFVQQGITRTMPALVGVHRLLSEHVLPVQVPVTSSDPKIRVFAYASKDSKHYNVIFINKRSTPCVVEISRDGLKNQTAWQLSARNTEDPEASYRKLEDVVRTSKGTTLTLPPESAVAASFIQSKARHGSGQ